MMLTIKSDTPNAPLDIEQSRFKPAQHLLPAFMIVHSHYSGLRKKNDFTFKVHVHVQLLSWPVCSATKFRPVTSLSFSCTEAITNNAYRDLNSFPRATASCRGGLHETPTCNKCFEVTRFYVWFA